MSTGHRVAMLGTGLIGDFYTVTLHGQQGRIRWRSSTPDRRSGGLCSGNGGTCLRPRPASRRRYGTGGRHGGGRSCPTTCTRRRWGRRPRPRKAVLVTKPAARSAGGRASSRSLSGLGCSVAISRTWCTRPRRSRRGLGTVGAVGDVLWVRSRATPGAAQRLVLGRRSRPGGAIVDLGCHCIEIVRSFVGQGRPVEVMCWKDTLVHPIERGRRDRADPLRERRARAVRGELDLPGRDGPARRGRRDRGDDLAQPLPADGLRAVHLRRRHGYVAEKAEGATGWQFPVGERGGRAGLRRHVHRHVRRHGAGREPVETLYDGYVVNAVMDACYRSARRDPHLGAGRARLARQRDAPSAPRTAWSSSRRSNCPTAAASSSSRAPPTARSSTAFSARRRRARRCCGPAGSRP